MPRGSFRDPLHFVNVEPFVVPRVHSGDSNSVHVERGLRSEISFAVQRRSGDEPKGPIDLPRHFRDDRIEIPVRARDHGVSRPDFLGSSLSREFPEPGRTSIRIENVRMTEIGGTGDRVDDDPVSIFVVHIHKNRRAAEIASRIPVVVENFILGEPEIKYRSRNIEDMTQVKIIACQKRRQRKHDQCPYRPRGHRSREPRG